MQNLKVLCIFFQWFSFTEAGDVQACMVKGGDHPGFSLPLLTNKDTFIYNYTFEMYSYLYL